MVSKGNHPQMAQLFRLVNYSNLPRFMEAFEFIYAHVFSFSYIFIDVHPIFITCLGTGHQALARHLLEQGASLQWDHQGNSPLLWPLISGGATDTERDTVAMVEMKRKRWNMAMEMVTKLMFPLKM